LPGETSWELESKNGLMQKMCGLRFFDEALEPHSWSQNRSEEEKKKIGL